LKRSKTCLVISRCCPVEQTTVLNFLSFLNSFITGASLIASGLVPKIKSMVLINISLQKYFSANAFLKIFHDS